MSFIRPEARDALRRYGEPALYAALAGWGLVHGVGLILRGAWTGWLLAVIGVLAALGLVGAAERALLAWRSRREGPGTVTIREGQIAYFGPISGAVLALDALTAVDIVVDGQGEMCWYLADETGQAAAIPAGADGAVALLDRLGTLQGFDHTAMIGAVRSRQAGRTPLWRRTRQAPASIS